MTDALANRRKERTDALASALLDLDKSETRRTADRVASFLNVRKEKFLPAPPNRHGEYAISICGGAGSGKSTFSEELSEKMGYAVFDLDKLVEGGWTPNRAEYEGRLNKAWQLLWDKQPSLSGWIVEHVEACNPDFLNMFKPNIAIFMNPGVGRLREVAAARNLVGEESSVRYRRALDSAIRAKHQFDEARGLVILKEGDIQVKLLT